MKRLIISALILFSTLYASAKDVAQYDTIPIKTTETVKLIEDEVINSKGKKVKKYYFLYREELLPTSKSVVDTYRLSQKYGAKCRLAVIKNKETNRKRIIRN